MKYKLTRLESLTAPSREVSDELLLSWGWEREWPDTPDEVWVSPIKVGVLEAQQVYDAADRPHPTASIDDALLGVPEGYTRAVDATVPEALIDVELFKGDARIMGRHASEPIALCIAIVKARGGV